MSSHSSYSENRVIGIKKIRLNKEKTTLSDDNDIKANELVDQAEEKVRKAEAQSTLLMKEAEEEIQRQKQDWEKQRTNLIKNAENEGFRKGFEQGNKEGYDEYLNKISQANQLIELAKKDYLLTVGSSEETIMDIAMKSAEKIINCELKEHPSIFVEIVKRALEEVKSQTEIIVYVHPDDYPILHSQREELDSITEFNSTLSIYIKDSVERSGCIIESSFGQIIAGVDPQLQEIRQKLFQIVHEEKSDE
ncbi:flagellar assembly protein FliH [Halobacillus sp. A1]|uniref:flagellar assembly protein FliH n=1 Tax=Halobacillus sp. A1 TaxID=2880262 RepID=UPI0020A686B3|nr:flagellar assembly protein FliH [Halobacillus sp. A1]MCP3031193.1 flagellar assembly protein FliH [Halobacillus sp. A1]